MVSVSIQVLNLQQKREAMGNNVNEKLLNCMCKRDNIVIIENSKLNSISIQPVGSETFFRRD